MMSLPTYLQHKQGYGENSVQKRLAEIVYIESKPEQMISRQGKHLEIFRDRVQMLGISESEQFDPAAAESGSQPQRSLIEKTFNYPGGPMRPQKKGISSISDISDEEERIAQRLHEVEILGELDLTTRGEENTAQRRRAKTQNKSPREFNTDLEFLERFSPREVSQMHPSFKNEGRRSIQTHKKAMEIGRWQPAIGTYEPQFDVTRSNDQDKLLGFTPVPDQTASKHMKKNKMRTVSLCERLEKKMIRDSIFHVYKLRKQQVQKEMEQLLEKKEQLRKLKGQQNIGNAIGNTFVKNMISTEEDQKRNVLKDLMEGNIFNKLFDVLEYRKTNQMRRNLQDQI